MKKYYLIALVLGILFACGGGDKPSSNNSSASNNTPAKKEVDGKKIWKSLCIACHGLYGDMEVNGAKDLNLSTLPLEDRIEIITNGKNVMTPFKGTLSEEEIKAVAQYTIDEFKKK